MTESTYMTNVNLVWITPNAESVIAYCARVSNPQNQDNPEYAKLLRYCAKNAHWSVFEMASMCVEIETTLPIATQILRHRSFSFQQFSQRYAEAPETLRVTPRRQDTKNRQNSLDNLDAGTKAWWSWAQYFVNTVTTALYKEALRRGIAKETARFLLPQSTKTRMYMSGTMRSWLHYVALRSGNGTQLEHQEIATQVAAIIQKEAPLLYSAALAEGV